MRTIQIFDTTLRDGEQSPGVTLTQGEKVEIALQLERLGVNLIEAGFAASSPGDRQAITAVGKAVKNATVLSLARCVERDIDYSWEVLREATSPAIHLFIATSPIHREFKLKMSREQVMEQALAAIRHAKKYFSMIEFSFEDGGRTEMDFLTQMTRAVIAAGANIVNIPDTVGYLAPIEYGNIFRTVRQEVPESQSIILSAHCHDDLGMAVANSLAAIEGGAGQIEGTINGIGERAGNAAIEEVAMALKTRAIHYQADTSLRHQEISRTSRLVSKLTGMVVPGNKAIVGANAFAHESGIHQDGMLKHPETYEIMTPETVGLDESRLVLGKHSGRHAFKDKLIQLGYPQAEEQINVLFGRFKNLADRKKEVSDEDIIALIEEKIGERTEYFTLLSLHVSYGSHAVPTSTLRIKDQTGEVKEEAACGNGSVDAIFKAVDRITEEEVELVDYRIHSVTHGKDAQGEVSVQLKQGDITVRGRGVSTDILEASARAYLDAVNRIFARSSIDRKPEGVLETATALHEGV
jgi:2-isopropylmalate synthase